MTTRVTVSIDLETEELTPSFKKVEKFLETQGLIISNGVISGFLESADRDADISNTFDTKTFSYELIEFENEIDANLFMLGFSGQYKRVDTNVKLFLDEMEPEQYQHPHAHQEDFILCFSNWWGSRRRFFELQEFKENEGMLMTEVFI